MRLLSLFAPLVAASLLSTACSSFDSGGDDSGECSGKCDRGDDTSGPSLCLAIRGNGPRITSHFGAIARVVEHYGLIDGVAGGSSGSISAFLIDSVHGNPLLRNCGGGACSPSEAADRAALLFKSMPGYFGAVAQGDEGAAVQVLTGLWSRIQSRGIPALLEANPQEGVDALRALLTSPEVRDLINPEALELLTTSPDPVFHARDLVSSVAGGLNFEATDPIIFVRPGLIDFEALATKLGRAGSFYAGYEPVDREGLDQFLTACASASRGLTWEETAALPAGGDRTCGERFNALVRNFRGRLLADEAAYASRADEPVGTHVRALVTTSVLEGDAVDAWRAARASYTGARAPSLEVDFADVRFGYFGRAQDLATVAANPRGFEDLKTRKFTSLGEVTWREALTYSPAEPGLARALELPDGRVSAGGWSDLQPVLVLDNLGCDRIVYITRRGGAGGFLTGIAEMLGLDADEDAALFDLGTPTSSYYRSLESAAGVWCTDWDAPAATDLPAMFADGYHAPFETVDPFFTEGARAYPNAMPSVDLPGCTPGVR